VIALLATYRGPSILAKLRITTEQAAAKRQLQAAAAENGGNDVEGEVTLLHYTATHGVFRAVIRENRLVKCG
jgi:hypothetical protein